MPIAPPSDDPRSSPLVVLVTIDCRPELAEVVKPSPVVAMLVELLDAVDESLVDESLVDVQLLPSVELPSDDRLDVSPEVGGEAIGGDRLMGGDGATDENSECQSPKPS